jgi:uncharacterized protein YjbI with pentapeptide repeats
MRDHLESSAEYWRIKDKQKSYLLKEPILTDFENYERASSGENRISLLALEFIEQSRKRIQKQYIYIVCALVCLSIILLFSLAFIWDRFVQYAEIQNQIEDAQKDKENRENEHQKLVLHKLKLLGEPLKSHIKPCMDNLTDIDLSGANLEEATLLGSDLSGANLSGANLSGANLSGAKLTSTNLSKTNLSGVQFAGTILVGANLSNARFDFAILRGAVLTDANIKGADLRSVRDLTVEQIKSAKGWQGAAFSDEFRKRLFASYTNANDKSAKTSP